MSSEPLRSVRAAARELGLSPTAVHRLVREKRIPHVEIGGRVWFRSCDIKAAVKEVQPTV